MHPFARSSPTALVVRTGVPHHAASGGLGLPPRPARTPGPRVVNGPEAKRASHVDPALGVDVLG